MSRFPIANDENAAEWNTGCVEDARTSLHFAVGKYFFTTPVHYNVNGGQLTGEGGCGLKAPEAAAQNDDNPQFMVATRFVATNPDPTRDFLVLCGTGQKVSDLQIYGRRWVTFQPYPSGPRAKSCIAIQALNQPPTGRHKISDCLLADADVGIATLEGAGDTHADLLFAENVYASDCRAFFQSNNAQSVSHTFVHCFQEGGELVGFELLKGGKIAAFSFYQNTPKATLVSVRDDPWPNCNHIEIHDYQWDHADVAGAYFCPLDSDKQSMAGSISGHANNPQPPAKFKFEYRDKGLRVNRDLKFRVANVGAK